MLAVSCECCAGSCEPVDEHESSALSFWLSDAEIVEIPCSISSSELDELMPESGLEDVGASWSVDDEVEPAEEEPDV